MRRVYYSLTYVANKWKGKWNNESAKAELKRLQAQLAEAKDELSQTQKDREYDIRKEGYQGLSDDLNNALQDTLDEVKYNASKQEEVISFGDNNNDILMIKNAGLGIAMGHSNEQVKKVANFITKTNDEDGVAKALENIVL